MIRKSFRIGIRMGVVAGVLFALYKLAQSRKATEPLPATEPRRPDPWPPVAAPEPTPPPPTPSPPPAPHPTPPVESTVPAPVEAAVKKAAGAVKKAAPKKVAKKAAKATKKATKKAAAGSGAWVEPNGAVCPLSHPIKVKLSSRIYHLPGMLAYTRTNPDRCYSTEDAAKSDGFSAAKR